MVGCKTLWFPVAALLQDSQRPHQIIVSDAALTVLAFPVGRNGDVDGMAPQMSHVTEKVHGFLGVPMLQLPVGGTHTAERLYLTRYALGHISNFLEPHFVEKIVPTFLK